MIIYIPVILTCLLGAPTPCIESNRDVAVNVTKLKPVLTPQKCWIDGYEKIAELAYHARAGENYYTRLICEPKNVDQVPSEALH